MGVGTRAKTKCAVNIRLRLFVAAHSQKSALHSLNAQITLDKEVTATHCNTLQHAATHCNTLQHIATQISLNKKVYLKPSVV